MKNIRILGGYGRAGKQIVALLLRQKSELAVALAGRNLEKARREAKRINNRLAKQNAIAISVIVANKNEPSKAFDWTPFI